MGMISFAPVLIPTLNRYEHLRRCVESLSRCTHADKTELVIGLDYPPSEKYVEGWKRISGYVDTITGFGKVTVFRREVNFGVHKNLDDIKKYAIEKYDYYIFSEDDNEFSPNFLDYMNKGLVKYKNDERIFCVCGYNKDIHIPAYYKNNFYIAQQFVAWGVGFWTHKERPEKYYSFDYLKGLINNDDSYHLLMKKRPTMVEGLITMLKQGQLWGDLQIILYETLENKYSICPTLSKVRNHGNDGTGLHTTKYNKSFNDFYASQPIDTASDFEFGDDIFVMKPDGIEYTTTPLFKNRIKKMVSRLIKRFDVFLLRHFHILFKSKYI